MSPRRERAGRCWRVAWLAAWLVLAVALAAGWFGGRLWGLTAAGPVAGTGGGGLAVSAWAGAAPRGAPFRSWLEPESVVLLERLEASAAGAAWWRTAAGGRHTLRLMSDDAAELWLDGRPLLALAAGDGRDRAEAGLDLEPGPHLLTILLTSGQRVGWAELAVQGPGQTAPAPLAAECLTPAYSGLVLARQGLSTRLERLARWTAWLALGGLALLALWRWRRRLAGARLPGGPRAWLISAAAALALYLGAWPLFWQAAVAPNLDLRQRGVYLEIFDGPGQAGESRADRHGLLSYSLHRPGASLAAFTVWRTAGGPRLIQLSGRQQVEVYLDGGRIMQVESRDYAASAVRITLTEGDHLLTVLASGREQPAGFQLRLASEGPGAPSEEGAPQLLFPDLGNIWGWWWALGRLKAFCLAWLGLSLFAAAWRWRFRRPKG